MPKLTYKTNEKRNSIKRPLSKCQNRKTETSCAYGEEDAAKLRKGLSEKSKLDMSV